MVPREVVQRVLEAGIRAPSGENSQPWRFQIEEDRVWLFNYPEADQSLFNFHQNGSYVAHGALLENVKIAAGKLGYELKIVLFPDQNKENLVATIDFSGTASKNEPLFEAIEKRITNRKHYDASPLHENEKKGLLENNNSSVRLILIDDREKIATLARAASVSETMLVLNKQIHDFFFSHVRWTPEENEKQPNGFFVDSLELNPQQAKGFKLLRSWGRARILAKLGVAKAIGRDNATTYATASAMLAIVIKDPMPYNLVLAGQVLEHAWLTATKLGLCAQPSTGVLFLAEGVPHENWANFSEKQRETLLGAKTEIYQTLGVDHHKEHVAVILRVGRSEPPSAQAARFPMKNFLI
jgi:hypothetical protein